MNNILSTIEPDVAIQFQQLVDDCENRMEKLMLGVFEYAHENHSDRPFHRAKKQKNA